jgi:hypothetical protein
MIRYPSNPTDAGRLINDIANLLRSEGVRAVALQQFFNAGDTNPAADALGSYEESFIAAALRLAAVEAIVLICMRACDKAKPGRYTIPTAAHLLAVPANFNAVAMRGDKQALTHFVRLAGELERDHALERLRKFRNFRLAHHLPEHFAAADKAKLFHLWEAVNSVLATIYHLVAGAGLATVSFDADASVWKQRCEAYWRRLIEGPPGRRVRGGGPTAP